MKKIHRLTESDLNRIIKRVLNETEKTDSTSSCTIDCMPGMGSNTPEFKSKSACCKTEKVFSPQCSNYIQNYAKSLQNCDKITFTN